MKHIATPPCLIFPVVLVLGLGAAFLTGCDPASQTGNSSEPASPTNATASPSASNSTTTSSVSAPEAKYAGVYLCQSPATTLRLEADKTGGMMMSGNAWEGTWTLTLDTDGQNMIEFKPDHAASSKFTILSDGSLKEMKYGYAFEELPPWQ
jgi:hypothetical protein